MATVIRSHKNVKAKKSAEDRVRLKGPTKVAGFKLPTTFEDPTGRFDDYRFLIHGEKKIGKTTLALQTEDGRNNVLVLQFDVSSISYRRMEVVCRDYDTLRAALKKLERMAESGDFAYQRVVLDNVEGAYRECMKWRCEKDGITHPEEAGYGKGWDAVRQEFSSAVNRLLALPCGVWFIAHSKWDEFETREGTKVPRLSPRMSGQCEEIVNSKVDGCFAYDYKDDNRVLILRGSNRVSAGHRLGEHGDHFKDREGNPLRFVKMGGSSSAAFRNLVAAFNNEYPKRSGSVAVRVRTKRKEL